jgi:hypothetical protein
MRPTLRQVPSHERDQRRVRIGVAGVLTGLVLFAAGILIAHFTGLSATDNVGREIYPHIPRCLPFETEGSCWILPTTGQLVALIGSQILLGAILWAWILGRPLTWARAAVAAAIFTLEMIVFFGIVPNQWLALTQGTFEWTGQKIAFTLPKWLMLNNEVSISYAVIKDLVSGGYSATLLIAIAVGAYRLQERAKRTERTPEEAPPRVSSFGRPVVGGER